MHEHAGSDAASGWVLALLPVSVAALLYLLARGRLVSGGGTWPAGRLWAALGGLTCLAVALTPPLAGRTGYFPAHIAQHLLTVMLAPLLLALSAPVTLALRSLPVAPGPAGAPRRLLLEFLHSRLVRVLTTPLVVAVLEVGSLYGLYLTPLFGALHQHPWAHLLIHTHMFLSGCLLSWLLISPDPMPHRPSITVRVVLLIVVAGSHNVLAKLMYAHALPAAAGPVEEVRLGAQWMYYGGDLIDVLLAVALLGTWYRRSGRALRHEQRRTAALGTAPSASRRS